MNVIENYYAQGATPFYACRKDPRFSYCMYVPERTEGDPEKYPVVVLVHGTNRNPEAYRNRFIDFANEHRVVVLAPLFPVGVHRVMDHHEYKFMRDGDTRYDEILLAMVDEAAEHFDIDGSKLLMHGFSGGGQFTQRFLYLHPERLRAACIGAPGRLTYIDDSRDWWLGTRNFEELFGKSIDLAAMREVEILMLVGDEDVETWELGAGTGSNWVEGVEEQGDTRLERLTRYHRHLADLGVESKLVTVPGIGHDGSEVLAPVRSFFARVLRGD